MCPAKLCKPSNTGASLGSRSLCFCAHQGFCNRDETAVGQAVVLLSAPLYLLHRHWQAASSGHGCPCFSTTLSALPDCRLSVLPANTAAANNHFCCMTWPSRVPWPMGSTVCCLLAHY